MAREDSQRFRVQERHENGEGEMIEEAPRQSNGRSVPLWLFVAALGLGPGSGVATGVLSHRGEDQQRVPPWIVEKLNEQDKGLNALREGRAGDRGEILTELKNLNKKVDDLSEEVRGLRRGR